MKPQRDTLRGCMDDTMVPKEYVVTGERVSQRK